MFSLWANDVFAKTQVLFDIFGLIKYQKSSYQNI